MNEANKTILIVASAIVVGMLLMFGGSTMTGATLSGGMMGNGTMGRINLMWIQTLLMFWLGALLVRIIVDQKKWTLKIETIANIVRTPWMR